MKLGVSAQINKNVEIEMGEKEDGRREWEEDPLGLDTNPFLLRAMYVCTVVKTRWDPDCMAFE